MTTPGNDTSGAPASGAVSYRPMRFQRWLTLAGFLVFAVAAVVVVIPSTVRGHGPPVLFTVLWLGALTWNAYWWLFRICTEVRVDAGTLFWVTPLRRGQAPTGDVVRIRPSRLGRRTAVIELQGRRPLLVPVSYGFGHLTTAIEHSSPQVEVVEP